MGTFKTRIEVNDRARYALTRECDNGVKDCKIVYTFDDLVRELRMWLPIYPVHRVTLGEMLGKAPEPNRYAQPELPPSPLAPEPLNNRPVDDPLLTPSRFQIGMPVNVAGTVVGVLFREGEVNYEVALGTTTELGEPDVTLVRAYDVEPRVMSHVGGGWA